MSVTRIVDDAEVLSRAEIAAEDVNALVLADQISTPEKCLEWCARRRLVRNVVLCSRCQSPASLNNYKAGQDGKRWKCQPCGVVRSIRDGSFFAKSKLLLRQIILLLYYWAMDTPQKTTSKETGISRAKLVDWYNFCRDECTRWLIRNPIQLGGFDDNGEPVVVEIDESHFFNRKYNHGRYVEGHWVFGMIERKSKRCILTIKIGQRTPSRTSSPLIYYRERTSSPTAGGPTQTSRHLPAGSICTASLYTNATLLHPPTTCCTVKTWRTRG